MHEFATRPVVSARPLAGYAGGKKQLARRLAEQIAATPHSLYGEAFIGMAGVFFRRKVAPKVEVINDLSGDVANLFRIVQSHHQAFLDQLRWQLSSRAEFERLIGQDPERLTDLQRAARFLYLQRLAFGGKVIGRTFGIAASQPARFDVSKIAPMIADVHERLAGVWIERLPWSTFLDRWDREGALFYLDPPYFGTEHYYGRGLFDRSDFGAMAERLARLKGRFILTVNDTPEMRDVFAPFAMEDVGLTYSVGDRNDHAAQELIITGPG